MAMKLKNEMEKNWGHAVVCRDCGSGVTGTCNGNYLQVSTHKVQYPLIREYISEYTLNHIRDPSIV